MSTPFCCDNQDRRAYLVQGGLRFNAIDYLLVADHELTVAVGAPAGVLRQKLLLVRFLRSVSGVLGKPNVEIEGGLRVTDIDVVWAGPLSDPIPGAATLMEETFWTHLRNEVTARGDGLDHWLVVRLDQRGDHSPYTFRVVSSPTSKEPPPDFDRVLSSVTFSFKVECATDFDCRREVLCPRDTVPAPELDYLARDYRSFRQLMLDRLSVTMPDWEDRSPADLGITLVELLAYAADRLSYRQDAVATEAYLDTARRRTSVRRHARLLDYPMHEGCNARTFVHIPLVEGQVLRSEEGEDPVLPARTQMLTRQPELGPVVSPARVEAAVNRGAEVFETMLGIHRLSYAHNEIELHTWGESRCVLPKGATEAVLADPGGNILLQEGDFLLFEEVRCPETHVKADADPAHRHLVRLTEVVRDRDQLYEEDLLAIKWHAEDALPFPLCLWKVEDPDTSRLSVPVTVARGNMVLVDHGRTIRDQPLPELEDRRHLRLPMEPLTWAWSAPKEGASAASCLAVDLTTALPEVRLRLKDEVWEPRRDLLGSHGFSREFVVEQEEDGRAYLRFGDDVHGLAPTPARDERFLADLRLGSGQSGNVGANSIAHIVSQGLADAVGHPRNPLAATGGTEPESIARVRAQAPQAFRRQERAVTEADWAEVTQRQPGVQRAVATLRWTGSWHTLFIAVDRVGGLAVDDAFKRELTSSLDRYRLAGLDLEIQGPQYVPLDIALVVCAGPDAFRADVHEELLDLFSSGSRRDGSSGFFHPDRFTFGKPVYLSQIVAAAMGVQGVSWVDTEVERNGTELVRFQRWGKPAHGELEAGVIPIDQLEVARLDNDPDAPDHGRFVLTMRGGR
jgi:hypothetical protein